MEIKRIKERLKYKDGKVYWRDGKNKGKVAGTVLTHGYVQVTIDKKKLYVHRLIFAMHYGYFPKIIDHIDRDRTNNLIDNLRDATTTLNSENRSIASNNTSGIRGVSLRSDGKKWTAQIKTNNKKIHLGCFDTIEEAEAARKKGEEVHFDS